MSSRCKVLFIGDSIIHQMLDKQVFYRQSQIMLQLIEDMFFQKQRNTFGLNHSKLNIKWDRV